MISRTRFPSSHACLILSRRLGPIPSTISSSPDRCSITERMSAPNLSTILLAKIGPIPFTRPLPKYLSIPSIVVGGTVLRAVAFSCSPCSLLRTQMPSAVSHSPALAEGREPMTVTTPRCPLALTRSTPKPVSSLK